MVGFFQSGGGPDACGLDFGVGSLTMRSRSLAVGRFTWKRCTLPVAALSVFSSLSGTWTTSPTLRMFGSLRFFFRSAFFAWFHTTSQPKPKRCAMALMQSPLWTR